MQLPPPIEILIASYGTTNIIIGLENELSITHSLRDSAGESLLATGAHVFPLTGKGANRGLPALRSPDTFRCQRLLQKSTCDKEVKMGFPLTPFKSLLNGYFTAFSACRTRVGPIKRC